MYRELARGVLIYGLCRFLSRCSALLVLPVVMRYVAPSDYGRIETVKVLSAVVHVVVALEISQAFALFFSQAKSDADRVAYWSTSLAFTAAAYIVFAGGVLWFSGPVGAWVLEAKGQDRLLLLALLSLGAEGLFRLVLNLLRWGLRPGQYAACDLVNAVVNSIVTLVLLLTTSLGVGAVLLGQLAGFAGGTALGAYLGRSFYRPILDVAKLKEMLAFSLPLILASLVGTLAVYADRIILKQVGTLTDMGLYAAACRFGAVAGMLWAVFETALTPLIMAHANEPETPRRIATLFRAIMFLSLSTFLALSIYSIELTTIFAGAHYEMAATLTPLTVATALVGGMSVFAPGWFLAQKSRIYAGVTTFATVIQIGLHYVLIPRWGPLGAAWGACAGSILLFIMLMAISQRLYPAPHAWGRLLTGSGLAIALVALQKGWESQGFRIGLASNAAWVPFAKAALLAAGVFALLRLLVRPGEFREFVRMAVGSFRKTAPAAPAGPPP